MYTLCPTLRISSDMPALTLNGEEGRLWKMKEFLTLKVNSTFEDLAILTLTLDPVINASLNNLYPHTKFYSDWKNFLWMGKHQDRLY